MIELIVALAILSFAVWGLIHRQRWLEKQICKDKTDDESKKAKPDD